MKTQDILPVLLSIMTVWLASRAGMKLGPMILTG
jgi:hypothetical protein